MAVTWVGIVLAFAAVWNSSWTMGLSTWWLGPQASPRSPVLLLLPFVAPLVTVAASFRGQRWLPYFGIAAAVCTALIAWGDVGRVNGFAVVEFALAGGGLCVSVAALTGLLRPARSSVPTN
jgi:hypothetical protein